MSVKVLMLILASDNEPIYTEFQTIWRKYMNSNGHIDCYFYKANPSIGEQAELIGDTLYVRTEEELDNVYQKTLKCFEYFKNKLNNYDFVFRTNLSSFIVMDKYIQYCLTIPRKRFVSGCIGTHESYTFPSGCGFTMSSDIVLELIEDNPECVFLDDVSIGKWLSIKGIKINGVNRFDFIHNSIEALNQIPIKDIFHYRIKNTDRRLDILIQRHLLKKYYAVSE